MTDYAKKDYGRNEETKELFTLFSTGRNISMHGPRRLGKTFVLDRMVERARTHGYVCTKIDLAGCDCLDGAFKRICEAHEVHHTWFENFIVPVTSRVKNFLRPRPQKEHATMTQAILSQDWGACFERMLGVMHKDKQQNWALLIDELPIFLKALHDKGEQGVCEARNFMNELTSFMAEYHTVRWLVTGSIGIRPLAKAGLYESVLSKLETYSLETLSEDQAVAFVLDLPLPENRGLPNRALITGEEAEAVVQAVGWRSAYLSGCLCQKTPTRTANHFGFGRCQHPVRPKVPSWRPSCEYFCHLGGAHP